MRSLVFCVGGLLGSIAIAPAVCPAEETLCPSFWEVWCLPFPLPQSLQVGDRWTYSTVSQVGGYWNLSESRLVGADTLYTDTLTVSVVKRLQLEDQTYFMLSDGGLYRVDGAGRTWQYDAEAQTEKVLWDVWAPPEDDVVVKGRVYGLHISRWGPYERHEWNYFNAYTLDSEWQNQLSDWGITELYGFLVQLPEGEAFLLIVPNVGVLYYEEAVKFVTYIERRKHTLQTFERGGGTTVMEDVSFGQIKHQIKQIDDAPSRR